MRTLILALAIAILVIIGSFVKAQKIDESLILYLPFDEGTGKVAKDFSKYHNDGAFNGDPKWVDGKFSKALEFDGVDDWVQMPNSEILQVDKEVTVMAWIKPERYTFPGTNWQGIIAKSNSPRSYSLYTEVSQGLHFSTSANVPQPFYGSVSTGKLVLKEWSHVAAVAETTKKGGWHRYYINGKPAGERFWDAFKALPGKSDAQDVLVGRTWEGGRFFLGVIDEVRVWNRALSEDEVQQQMKVGKKGVFAVYPHDKLTVTWGAIKKAEGER